MTTTSNRPGVAGALVTKKKWSALIEDLETVMRRWGIHRDDYILPKKRESDRGREVHFRYVLNNEWQAVSCSAMTPGKDDLASERNLAGVVQIIDAMRLADQRGIGKELAQAAAALMAPIDQRTAWEVLRIARGATAAQILSAWRIRVKATHPDTHPGKRKEYDAVMAAGRELGAIT